MNTKAITVSAKSKAKWEKIGAVVAEPTLPPHLQKFIDKRASELAAFGMFQITVDLDKVDPWHPIQAMV